MSRAEQPMGRIIAQRGRQECPGGRTEDYQDLRLRGAGPES
ncbi:hypothetical protein [Nesterenkonia ebinurensis]|nr:hypothetical protein [Nesterenkonia ebinurensis]